jgi:hypothetical protein
MTSKKICMTRGIKNAKHIQKIAPHIIPKEEAAEGFTSIIPSELLVRLHTMTDLQQVAKNKHLVKLLEETRLPLPMNLVSSPLFNGTLYFVQIQFNTPNGFFSISDADMQTMMNYARLAINPISQYASQYGQNYVDVSGSMIRFPVTLQSNNYNDHDLEGWVNTIASQNHLSPNSCVVVPNPASLGIMNIDISGGYHSKADVPWITFNVYGQNIDIQDTQDVYANPLSHELAEMVVDPYAQNTNPEVCDPCAGNCGTTFYNFFDSNNIYITTSTPPVTFRYSYSIASIVQPVSATQCYPQPTTACTYAPPYFGSDGILTNFEGLVKATGFYSSGDGVQHAIAATRDGTVYDYYWQPGGVHMTTPLVPHSHFGANNIVGVAGYYNSRPVEGLGEDLKHVIVGTTDGNVTELYWKKPGPHVSRGPLPGFSANSIVGVAGYYNPDPKDQNQHVIVGTTDGNVTELYWGQVGGVSEVPLTQFSTNGVVGIAGYYSDDDQMQHVVVALNDGNVCELVWKIGQRVQQRVLPKFNGIVGVAGYHIVSEHKHVLVGTSDGIVTEAFF